MEDLTHNSAVPSSSKANPTSIVEAEVKEQSPAKQEDPQYYFIEGDLCQKRGELEKSIEMYCKALELATLSKGELDISLYKYYYQYADALLIQLEKNNEGQIFGEMVPEEIARTPEDQGESSEESEESATDQEKEAENQTKNGDLADKSEPALRSASENEEKQGGSIEESEEAEESEESEEGDEEDEEDSENKRSQEDSEKDATGTAEALAPVGLTERPEETNLAPENEEKLDDLQIAWECLESARVILKSSSVLDVEFLLKVLTRIGDLETYKEEYEKANEEFSTSLTLLTSLEGLVPSRRKAELHYLLGSNFLQVKGKETEASDHFTKALENLEGVLQKTTETAVREELIDVIKEVINKREDALEQKLSIQALKELGETKSNVFDAPSVSNVVDLGIISKRKREQNEDPEFPDANQEKKPSN